jgi:hypothetical protein
MLSLVKTDEKLTSYDYEPKIPHAMGRGIVRGIYRNGRIVIRPANQWHAGFPWRDHDH